METNRILKVGPFVSFRFESGVKPGGGLTATFTIDIDDPRRRDRELYRLAGIEESTYIELNQERIPGVPTEYDERTTPDGKTSSVHWVRFVFTPEHIVRFKDPAFPAVLGVAHPAYGHMAVLSPEVRAELAKDFA